MHSIWLSVTLPLMFLAVWGFPKTRDRTIWTICFCLALAGLGLLIGLDVMQFISTGGPQNQIVKRMIFAVITSIEFPLVALLVGCAMNWTVSWRYPAPLEKQKADADLNEAKLSSIQIGSVSK